MTSRRLGLIIPLTEEFEYVRSGLDIVDDIRMGGWRYHRFLIRGTDVGGVLTIVHEMGQPNAALAARDMISDFGPPLVAVIGTAAALSDDVALGDVVIASEIHDYLHASKAVPDPGDPTKWHLALAGTSWKPNFRLLSHLQDYPTTRTGRQQVDHWAESAVRECRIAQPFRPSQGPRCHVAPIATGDLVGAAPAFVAMLKQHNRKLAALEMEAGGAALSAYQQENVDLMVVRGVSDRAGTDKASTDATIDIDGAPNAWRAYAVTNATSLLITLVSSPDFPWRRQEDDEPLSKRNPSWATIATTSAVVGPLAYLAGGTPKGGNDPIAEPVYDITAELLPNSTTTEPYEGATPHVDFHGGL